MTIATKQACLDCNSPNATVAYVLGDMRCRLCAIKFSYANMLERKAAKAARDAATVDHVWGCPYCGDEKDTDDRTGCCGESSDHYEFLAIDEQGDLL